MINNIKTQAGKDLWNHMNRNFGSGVWGPVGEGIIAIEAEMEILMEKELAAGK